MGWTPYDAVAERGHSPLRIEFHRARNTPGVALRVRASSGGVCCVGRVPVAESGRCVQQPQHDAPCIGSPTCGYADSNRSLRVHTRGFLALRATHPANPATGPRFRSHTRGESARSRKLGTGVRRGRGAAGTHPRQVCGIVQTEAGCVTRAFRRSRREPAERTARHPRPTSQPHAHQPPVSWTKTIGGQDDRPDQGNRS